MLKTSNVRLMYPSQATTASTASVVETAHAPSEKSAPSASETRGPAIAIRNSAPALGNIPLNFATPPKSHSVMPSISIPSRRAWNACPSSWRSSDAKKAAAATIAIAL
jgi:hypothetical protein